jgi:hypothetical protein
MWYTRCFPRPSMNHRWIVGALLAVLTGCGAEANEQAHEGTLRAYGGLTADGQAFRSYALETEDGLVPLEFEVAPALDSGARLIAEGDSGADGKLRVRNFDVVEPDSRVGTVQQGLTFGEARSSELAVVLVHGGTPDAMNEATIRERLLTSPTSARALLQESSFGELDITADVFGWYQISATAVSTCDAYTMAVEGQAAAQAAGVDLSGYDHVLYYFPSSSACWFGGLGEVGTPTSPARQTWYNGWFDTYVLTHEIGHNLGFWHGHSMYCDGAAITTNPAACTKYEYGDVYDPMGSGTVHFNGYFKAAQGWLEGCNLVTSPAGGEYTLAPIELETDQPQVIQVPASPSVCPDGGSCFYYLEYRQPLGAFDGGAYDTALMHTGISVRIGSSFDPTGLNSVLGAYLLDLTPNYDVSDGRLAMGSTFTDPTGLTISALAAANGTAQVRVSVPSGSGQATCLDGSAYDGGDPGDVSTYPQMYLRGTNNAWATAAMTLVDDYTWQISATFGGASNERFKFDVYGNWATNFGDNGANGVADASGADIAITQGAGDYVITFNDSTRAYTVVKDGGQPPEYQHVYPQVYVRGTTNTWGTTAMTLIADNSWQVTATFGSASNERFKFDVYGNWATNFGDNGADGTADANGADIAVTQGAGEYVITFNDSTRAYTAVKSGGQQFLHDYPQVYLRGTSNAWATTPMSLVADYTFQIDVTFGSAANERFKFDVYGNWASNFGDNGADGVADANGADIAITQGAGTYRIFFQERTKSYGISKL